MVRGCSLLPPPHLPKQAVADCGCPVATDAPRSGAIFTHVVVALGYAIILRCRGICNLHNPVAVGTSVSVSPNTPQPAAG